MAFYPIKNNVTTTLRSAYSPGDGVIHVAVGTGSFFGVVFPIRVTCQRLSDNAVVIFQVSGITSDNLTVTTIEGTTDISLSIGDVCEMRFTAGAITAIQDALVYSTSTATTGTIGGIDSGSSFDHAPLTDVIDALLHAYEAPAFTSFSITGSATQEVGATYSGTKTFTWTTSNSSNVATNSISVLDVTGSFTLGSSLANDGSEALSTTATHNLPATHTWSINGTNTHSGSFSSTTSINWFWKVFNGTSVSTTLDESGIEGLATGTLKSGFSGTYIFTTGGYKYLAYPDSLGGVTSFTDSLTLLSVAMCTSADDASYSNTQNGFSYALVSVTNPSSITTNYRVYRTKNVLGSSINIIVA